MAFDFPNSPSIGSTHSTSGATYVYDGEKWVVSTSFTGTINIEDEIPAGTISSSAQIEAVITDAYISSSVNSSNIGFDGNYDNLNSVPIGIVSSSAQITSLGFVSESVGSTPSGTISGSSQITALGFVSESGVNSSVNTFTESIQSEVDSLTAATSSYLTSLPSGTISGSAQIDRTWTLGADGSSNYTFTGPGLIGTENDPTLYLTRGETYRFVNEMGAHPFRIQSDPNGSTGTQYNDGVTNNDVSNGTLIIDVQFDAPSRIYYQCTAHPNMGGVIEILDKLPSGVISGSEQLPSGVISGSEQLPSGLVSSSEQLPSGLVSGSSQIADLGYVSSTSVDTIQVMTAAAYSGITPVSGVLYIIQG